MNECKPLASGSYGSQFRSFDTATGGADTLEVTKNPQRLRQLRANQAAGVRGASPGGGIRGRGRGESPAAGGAGRGSHSSTIQLNMSRF